MGEGVPAGLTPAQARRKRVFDVVVAGAAATLTAPVVAVAVLAARRDTGGSGIFAHERIGQGGHPFMVHKVRTMAPTAAQGTTVTTADDPRITPLGRRLRQFKIDELPQLFDVLRGTMSLVGPRPDVAGWADTLTGEDRIVLSVRPGITGPASLAFRHEESELAAAEDPEQHNREVIWPQKVRINREYVETWSLLGDVRYLIRTVLAVADRR
jgi:lipopolysaccharide/colanic/teichoic acid biosynthesis glycosyltransferase